MNTQLFFLPAILVLGIITSYEDIKFGKIRNKWIIAALLYFLILNVFIVLNYIIKGVLDVQYLIELSKNFFLSVLVGFGLWYLRIWTAGDGKLFIAYSALIPLSVYRYGYERGFPSVTLLSNTFIVGLLFILIGIFRKKNLKNLKNIQLTFLKKMFQPKELLTSVIYLFAIYWIIGVLLLLVGLQNNYFMRMFLTVSIMFGFRKKLGEKTLYAMLVISALRLLVDKTVYSFAFLKDFLILIIIWKLLIKLIAKGFFALDAGDFFEEKKVVDLKPGMLLGDKIDREKVVGKKDFDFLKKCKDAVIIKKLGFYYIKKPRASLELNNFIDEEPEGLTQEQINKIKRIGFKKIRVAKTIPFAPLMFLGVIFTLIAKGNILILIKILF